MRRLVCKKMFVPLSDVGEESEDTQREIEIFMVMLFIQ